MESLRVLPGVGPKSAQRMAYHLLARERAGGERLGTILAQAMTEIGTCEQCRDFTEQAVCAICANSARDTALLCVVESPADRLAIDNATGFRGKYFVLHGRLSPLDGIGPADIGLDILQRRLAQTDAPQELIIATNPTIEGEATAHYVAGMAREAGIQATRLAHGVPLGGELEYLDRGTLAHAFGSRSAVDD